MEKTTSDIEKIISDIIQITSDLFFRTICQPLQSGLSAKAG